MLWMRAKQFSPLGAEQLFSPFSLLKLGLNHSQVNLLCKHFQPKHCLNFPTAGTLPVAPKLPVPSSFHRAKTRETCTRAKLLKFLIDMFDSPSPQTKACYLVNCPFILAVRR